MLIIISVKNGFLISVFQNFFLHKVAFCQSAKHHPPWMKFSTPAAWVTQYVPDRCMLNDTQHDELHHCKGYESSAVHTLLDTIYNHFNRHLCFQLMCIWLYNLSRIISYYVISLFSPGWPFGSMVCKMSGMVQGISVSASVFTLVAIAVDR